MPDGCRRSVAERLCAIQAVLGSIPGQRATFLPLDSFSACTHWCYFCWVAVPVFWNIVTWSTLTLKNSVIRCILCRSQALLNYTELKIFGCHVPSLKFKLLSPARHFTQNILRNRRYVQNGWPSPLTSRNVFARALGTSFHLRPLWKLFLVTLQDRSRWWLVARCWLGCILCYWWVMITEERTTTAGIHLCCVITSKCTTYSDVYRTDS